MRGRKDQLSLQLCQVPPQLDNVLASAASLASPLLLLLRLHDGVPQGAGGCLERHQVGWPVLLGFTARLLHYQDLK